MLSFPLPIENNVLKKTGVNLSHKYESLLNAPGEFRNTFLNQYYSGIYVLTHGSRSLEFIMQSAMLGGRDEIKRTNKHLMTIQALLKMRDSVINSFLEQEISRGDMEFLCQVWLDEFKYDIDNASSKSLIRRNIERKFSKPILEHPNMWEKLLPYIKG